ncbi:putative ribosomal protein, partial [Catenaria anguillulae PL171]
MTAASLFYKVTLRRSTIGLPETTRKYAKVMGLTRLHKSVLLPVKPDTAGNILKIKELVEVENVALPRGLSPKQAIKNLNAARKPHPGYSVIGNAMQKHGN